MFTGQYCATPSNFTNFIKQRNLPRVARQRPENIVLTKTYLKGDCGQLFDFLSGNTWTFRKWPPEVGGCFVFIYLVW